MPAQHMAEPERLQTCELPLRIKSVKRRGDQIVMMSKGDRRVRSQIEPTRNRITCNSNIIQEFERLGHTASTFLILHEILP